MNEFDKLKKIIASKTSSSEDNIDMNTSMKNLSKWDSMAHLQITMEIEKKFKKIKTSELMSLTSIKEILRYIKN
tara:strand:+ start:68 stop:289 length:222 start_codon:yes stop_codon:yes gene_type:complete